MTRKSLLLLAIASLATVAVGTLVFAGLRAAIRRHESEQLAKYSPLPGKAFAMKAGPVIKDAGSSTCISFEVVNQTQEKYWLRTNGDAIQVYLSNEDGSELRQVEVSGNEQSMPIRTREFGPGTWVSASCQFVRQASVGSESRVHVMLRVFTSAADAKAGKRGRIWVGPAIALKH